MSDHPVTDEENEMYWRVLGNQWPNISCDMVAKILKRDDEIRAQRKASLDLRDRAAEVVPDAKAAEALEFLYHLRLGTGVKIGDLVADMSAAGNPDAMRFEDMMSAYATSKEK
jgi:hypothetical protein